MRRPAALAIVLLFAAACGRAPDVGTALEESTRETGDAATAAASMPVDAGETRRAPAADVRLPADFPADIRLPDDYAVVSVMTMGASQSVVLRSGEPMAALFEQFRTTQTERGWEETVSMQGVEGAMLGFHKAGRGVLANFRPDMEGRTLVSLSLQPQAPTTRE